MSKLTKKSDFDKLKAEWYKKLKDDGFVDIETTSNNGTDTLIDFSNKYATKDPYTAVRKEHQEYYIMAEHFLNEYKFDSNIEKVIWEYHSNGIGVKAIAKILQKAKVNSIGVKKSNVWLIVQKLKKSMYAMYLAPKIEYHER